MATGASISTVGAYLKEVYPGTIEDSLNEEIGLLSIIEKEKVSIGGQGQHIVRPFRTGRQQGIGSRNENDNLPLAGKQTTVAADINMSTAYMRGQITGPVIRATYTDQAAFENALDFEMRYGITDFTYDIARQIYMGNGQLTTVNGAVTSSTSVVVNNVQYLAVGMLVEFWNASTNETANDAGLPSGYTGTVITAINTTTNTLTVTTAQTLTTGDAVARQGNNTSATATKEIQGLNTIIGSGAYFGITRTSGLNTILQGNVVNANHANTETVMQLAFDSARQIGGSIINYIGCDYASRRVYSNMLTSNKRYPVEGIAAPEFAGGLAVSKDLRTQMGEGLSFSGAMVAPSQVAPPAQMQFLDTNTFKMYLQTETEWLMNADSVLHPLAAAQNIDAYQFIAYRDFQLFCDRPQGNALVTNTF